MSTLRRLSTTSALVRSAGTRSRRAAQAIIPMISRRAESPRPAATRPGATGAMPTGMFGWRGKHWGRIGGAGTYSRQLWSPPRASGATLAEEGVSSAVNRQEEENEGSTILFTVEGMRCGGCSAAVQKVLVATPGVSRAAVNLVTETAAVELAAGASESTIAEFTKAVGDKGFTMSPRPVGRAAEVARGGESLTLLARSKEKHDPLPGPGPKRPRLRNTHLIPFLS